MRGRCLLLFLSVATALRVTSPRASRREAITHGFIAAATLQFEAGAARADDGMTPGDLARAKNRAQLQDPFAAGRESGYRAPFADELAPTSPEERQRRAALAKEAAESTRPSAKVTGAPAPAAGKIASPRSDEFTLEFDATKPLGLRLKDLRIGFEYGTKEGTSRVLVQDVDKGGQAEKSGKVSMDNVVVAVDGVNVERESARQVTNRLAKAKTSGQEVVSVTFKDVLAFNEQLSAPTVSNGQREIATTIAPATEKQEAQVLAVRRLEVPTGCRRNAENGDLLEIRYAGRLADGTVFDGMDLAARLADDSIQFVLGRQPAGQFPPSWDVGLVGMCVGERREIDVPPVLGFGPKGMPKRGIPPDARLVYEVELLTINALATP